MSETYQKSDVSRRDFLQAAGGAVVVSALPARLPAEEGAGGATTKPSKLAAGVLGRTKYPVTRVSFGAIRIKPPHGTRLLKTAIDYGVNLVHTARGYTGGKSVEAIGALFKEHPEYRQRVFLCLKNTQPGDEKYVDEDLARLNTDHVDMLMPTIHKADPGRLETIVKFNEMIVKKGKARFGAFTTHGDMNGVIELILKEAPDAFDGTLMSMAPAGIRLGSSKQDESDEVRQRFLANIKGLRKQGVGIISMKSGAKRAVGRGKRLFEPHCKSVLQAGADTVLTSFGNFNEVEVVPQLDLSSLAMTGFERRLTAALCDGDCMMCGACTHACPQGLPVADLVRVGSYPSSADWAEHAVGEYAALGVSEAQVASACSGCAGACSGACPIQLASGKHVRRVAAHFDRALA